MGILLDKLTAYSESDYYPYHMPGHKRQISGDLPQKWTDIDITEIDGFDNLHDAQGILRRLQEKAADAYGAQESFYLVNGSTCGILSAISVAVPFGGELLIVRNCHKSVYHGAYLRQLKLQYIYPKVVEGFDICEAVTSKQVEDALETYPNVNAVLIVSPTYEGRIADVEEIARVVHKKGLPLLVDEAHGAHLGFSERFAMNSARLGADIVINSVHKTLPALTQTALLHVNGRRIERDSLKRFLHIYQTSSPSYLLMSSIEEAVQLATMKDSFEIFARRWYALLEKLTACKNLQVLPASKSECEECRHDIGKLVISAKGCGLSGQQLYDILLEEYHLQAEMVCESFVLCMFTIQDTLEGYTRLAEALLKINGQLHSDGKEGQKIDRMPYLEEEMPFYEAWEMEKESVPLAGAEGRLVGEFINLYPPGTPIAVPGERLSKNAINVLENCLAGGLTVQGISGDGYVEVLKEI